jgi:outer membrane protein OmpA-like peptidoglycan-associated protein
MGLKKAVVEELQRGQVGATQERHTFATERNPANVIEIDDLQFHVGSSIVMPAPIATAPKPENATITGLSAIAQLFEQHESRPLWVAGHADDTKVALLNQELAKKRAENALAIVKGDADAFAASCTQLDCKPLQTLLAWASRVHAHDCDPGPIDGDNNTATRAALDRFRAHHAERFDVTFNPLPEPTPDDWKAFFTLYDLTLAELLELEPDALAGKRSALVFHDPSVLGAGDRFALPSGPRALELRSASKRRVDLVLFDPAVTIPKIDDTGAAVYADELRVLLSYLPPERPPGVTCVRLLGMFFDTNKNFLLPIALRGLRRVVEIYEETPEAEVLIVGHTDTSGDAAFNDKLSLERAESMLAYLKDDVDTWLKRYDKSVPEKKRWGAVEDELMLEAMPDIDTKPADEDLVKWFQRTRELAKVDGICGKDTRTKLIGEYMAFDGTTLPASAAATVHGCGENFPTGATADGQRVQQDRRVELFFFEDGIDPPPPGDNSGPDGAEYPRWRARTTRTTDISERGNLAFDFAFERDAEAGVIKLQFSVPGQVQGPLFVRIAEMDNAVPVFEREAAIRAAGEAAAAGPGLLKSGCYHEVLDGEALPGIAVRYGHQDANVVLEHFANFELREERPGGGGIQTGDFIYIPQHIGDRALVIGPRLPTEDLERAEGGSRRLEAKWPIAATRYDLLDPAQWRSETHLGAAPLHNRDLEIEEPTVSVCAPQIVVLDEKNLSIGVSPTPFELVRTVEYTSPTHTEKLLVFLEGGLFREVPAQDGSHDFRRAERPTALFGALPGAKA